MKKVLYSLVLALVFISLAHSQQTDMAEIRPDGVQIPVVDHTQVNNPAQGLLVYDVNSNSYWYFDGGQWVGLAASNLMQDLDGDTRIFIDVSSPTDTDEITFDVKNRTAFEIRETPSAAEILQFRVPDFNHGNLFFGLSSGEQIDTTGGDGNSNTVFGINSGGSLSTGNGNTFMGTNAGAFSTTGRGNTFVGNISGSSNDIGSNNTFMGENAGGANVSGGDNVYIGAASGTVNDVSSNTIIGFFAGHNNSTNQAVMVGNGAGSNNQGQFATIVGFSAGQNNQGDGNTMIGYNAGNKDGLNMISGGDNVFLGTDSGQSTTSGNQNSFIGRSSGRQNLGGDRNTYMGAEAGQTNENGSDNVYIGSSAGLHNYNGSGNVFIGSSVGVDPNNMNMNYTVSGQLRIDNTNTESPLLSGDFINDQLGINWDINNTLPATLSVNGTAHISETLKLQPQPAPSPLTCSDMGTLLVDTNGVLYFCDGANWKTVQLN